MSHLSSLVKRYHHEDEILSATEKELMSELDKIEKRLEWSLLEDDVNTVSASSSKDELLVSVVYNGGYREAFYQFPLDTSVVGIASQISQHLSRKRVAEEHEIAIKLLRGG